MTPNDAPDAGAHPEDAPSADAADSPASPDAVKLPVWPPNVEPDMDAIREALAEAERKANADRFRSMGW